jgi:predicted permease
VPVSLLLVGYNVAGFSLRYVFGDVRSYLYSGLRLVLIPGLFLAILRLLGMPDLICVMAVLYLACPSGMNAVVFPASYGMDCKAGIGMVLVSSILAIVTAPLMYALTTL